MLPYGYLGGFEAVDKSLYFSLCFSVYNSHASFATPVLCYNAGHWDEPYRNFLAYQTTEYIY